MDICRKIYAKKYQKPRQGKTVQGQARLGKTMQHPDKMSSVYVCFFKYYML